jgi:hypothetical protein
MDFGVPDDVDDIYVPSGLVDRSSMLYKAIKDQVCHRDITLTRSRHKL